MSERVVFLDFDGVIRVEVDDGWTVGSVANFCQGRMKMLADVCAVDGVRIVVSSDWRQSSSLKEVESYLAPYLGEFIHPDWKTPVLGSRWMEVGSWLAAHPGVNDYAILEDTRFHFLGCPPKMEDRIAWCNNRFGLVPEVATRVMRIFSGD